MIARLFLRDMIKSGTQKHIQRATPRPKQSHRAQPRHTYTHSELQTTIPCSTDNTEIQSGTHIAVGHRSTHKDRPSLQTHTHTHVATYGGNLPGPGFQEAQQEANCTSDLPCVIRLSV